MESGLPRVQPRHFLRHWHRRTHRLRRSEPTAADIFAASGRQPIRAREQEKEILAHLRGCRCTGMCGPHPGDLCRGRNLAQRWTRAGVPSEGRSRHRQEASCTDESRFSIQGQSSMRSVKVAVHMPIFFAFNLGLLACAVCLAPSCGMCHFWLVVQFCPLFSQCSYS